jgi:hypothetical protein
LGNGKWNFHWYRDRDVLGCLSGGMFMNQNPFVLLAMVGAGIGVIGGIITMFLLPELQFFIYEAGVLIYVIGIILAIIGDRIARHQEKKAKNERNFQKT